MADTNFDSVAAATFTGNLIGNHNGGMTGLVTLSKAVDYALAAAEKDKQFYAITLTAGSKTVTLGNTAGTWCIVHNAGGTNTFTLKNVAGDTGTSLAAGKTVIVIPSATANASIVIALN
jgi:hypothetical protein